LCVIEAKTLVEGMPRPNNTITITIIDKEIIDAGREYIIIEGFPTNSGTIIDFNNEIIYAEKMLIRNRAIISTILDKPNLK
jgi:hypothetical protein